MKAFRVTAASDDLLHPDHALWREADSATLKMETPPIGNVPSNYFRAMNPLAIGAVKRLQVSALHNGEALFFRLEWEDPSEDVGMEAPGKFRDGAGVLFPFGDTAPINNMGSKKDPVNAWCWQAGREQPLNVTAAGLGTTRREDNSYCLIPQPVYADGRWKVVIARPFTVPEPSLNVALAPGMKKAVGFAVWEGGNGERAGAKSFCGNWNEVEIAP
jgi:DMSO reductase family type II enzyme heme b subunit